MEGTAPGCHRRGAKSRMLSIDVDFCSCGASPTITRPTSPVATGDWGPPTRCPVFLRLPLHSPTHNSSLVGSVKLLDCLKIGGLKRSSDSNLLIALKRSVLPLRSRLESEELYEPRRIGKDDDNSTSSSLGDHTCLLCYRIERCCPRCKTRGRLLIMRSDQAEGKGTRYRCCRPC